MLLGCSLPYALHQAAWGGSETASPPQRTLYLLLENVLLQRVERRLLEEVQIRLVVAVVGYMLILSVEVVDVVTHYSTHYRQSCLTLQS